MVAAIALLPADKRAPSDYSVSLAWTSMQTGIRRQALLLSGAAQIDDHRLYDRQNYEIVRILFCRSRSILRPGVFGFIATVASSSLEADARKLKDKSCLVSTTLSICLSCLRWTGHWQWQAMTYEF